MKKILIVDDEKELCEMIKKCLERTGFYQAITTSMPEEVVTLSREQRPDLILLDIVMPGLQGTDIIKMLKESPETQSIPVVVTSGMGEMVYHEGKDKWRWEPNRPIVRERGVVLKEHHATAAAQAYGVDDFLAKPFSRETLLQVLEEVFARSGKASNPESKPPLDA